MKTYHLLKPSETGRQPRATTPSSWVLYLLLFVLELQQLLVGMGAVSGSSSAGGVVNASSNGSDVGAIESARRRRG